MLQFLLTRLLRGATNRWGDDASYDGFLLTRLLRGATQSPFLQLLPFYDFYSRASCEARLGIQLSEKLRSNFYSRASCEARRIEYLS